MLGALHYMSAMSARALNSNRAIAAARRLVARALDDADGGPDHALDVETGGVEHLRVRRPAQRRHGAGGVARVAAADVGEYVGRVGRLALAAHFEDAAARPHLRRGGDENLGV